MRTPLMILLVVGTTGCGTGPSHLPNPVLLPGQAVTTGFENAAYNARRNRVSTHVEAHHALIMSDVVAGTGPQLTKAMDLARVAPARRPALTQVMQEDMALYRRDPEALVVALMVHGP